MHTTNSTCLKVHTSAVPQIGSSLLALAKTSTNYFPGIFTFSSLFAVKELHVKLSFR